MSSSFGFSNVSNAILNMMDTTQEPEDYKGEDGLLYCGKCHKPKEAYFPQGKALFGRDRHPSECDCRRAEREMREKEETEKKHNDEVAHLKREGFTDPAMREWTFRNDNGNCPQIEKAHFYVEHWGTMCSENIGYLLWGNVGTGKSYFAGCIANALMDFLLLDKDDKPKAALHIENEMRWAMKKYKKLHSDNPLPHITPHVFRHTFCTNMANAGMDIKTLQYVMGCRMSGGHPLGTDRSGA